MKKLQLIMMTLLIGIMVTACHTRHNRVIISTSTNNSSMQVEYSGQLVFNSEKTAIENMSPGSYLKFENNGENLTVKCNENGVIWYKLQNNEKSNTLNQEGKILLLEAIKMIEGEKIKQRQKQPS